VPTTDEEIAQFKERMRECNEEMNSLWKTLGPVERGWIDLPDEEVARLKRRMSECEAEAARLRREMPDMPPPRRSPR
jgi:hypothetical protein